MDTPAEGNPEISDADLIAFLDGELPPRKRREVQERLSEDAGSRQRLAVYKKTWDLLDILPKPEPSRAFTARTIERIEPLPASAPPRASAVSLPAVSNTAVSNAAAFSPAPRRSPWLLWTAAALVGLSSGYGGRALLVRPPNGFADNRGANREESEEILKNIRVLKDLHLYRYVDDLELANELAAPEYFGDDRRERSGP